MIDLVMYEAFLALEKCLYCKKEMPLYLKKKGEAPIINPSYLEHAKDTHGYPPFIILDKIEQMYQTEELKQNFRDFMKRNYSHFKFMRDYV